MIWSQFQAKFITPRDLAAFVYELTTVFSLGGPFIDSLWTTKFQVKNRLSDYQEPSLMPLTVFIQQIPLDRRVNA